MADKFLIRMFDVGLGDCIYCRIPGAHIDGRDFHILIDCGSWSGMELLEAAVAKLKTVLPDIGGKKQLDLLIVTHQHKDHIAGFGPSLWAGISIGAIWMSVAMDKKHPEAEKTRRLHAFAGGLIQQAQRLNASPELEALFTAYAFDNDVAMQTLQTTLPTQNHIDPVYVHAGMNTGDGLALPLKDASLHILGPENDIDYYYLGKPGNPSLRGLMGVLEGDVSLKLPVTSSRKSSPIPTNIAAADFRQLKSRMSSSALAFADLDGKVTNNTSVVLLIEWKGRRLLFVGDAEWEARYVEGKGNGSWNVMWNKQRPRLGKPLDFLKIGHHGSENATPWNDNPKRDPSRPNEPLDILNAILPKVDPPTAKAVVSTQRGRYKTIPKAPLLVELGTRVISTRDYAKAFTTARIKTSTINKFDDYEKDSFTSAQPLRTDFEDMLHDQGFIDVEITA